MNHSSLYTEHNVPRRRGRPGLAAISDVVVLLLVLKNAGWSVYSQTFGSSNEALAVVLWYGLAVAHVTADGRQKGLSGLTRLLCAAMSLAAWAFLPGQVIAAHDWALLALSALLGAMPSLRLWLHPSSTHS